AGGSTVSFSGLPALSTALQPDATLRAQVPDGVVGASDVSVGAPGLPGVASTVPAGVLFTLPRIATVAVDASTSAVRGTLLVAVSAGPGGAPGTLNLFDISFPDSPKALPIALQTV